MWEKLTFSDPTVWLAVLGTYGAIEASLRLVRAIPKWAGELKRKWQYRLLDKDFYFNKRESGYRVLEDGTTYLHVRRETVVALKTITEIPVSYSWTGEGTTAETVSPSKYRLEDVPRIKGQTRIRKKLVLDAPLGKGKSVTYTFEVKCTRTGKPPETFLGSLSSHRVDDLMLRVIFPIGGVPSKVFYAERDADGNELVKEPVSDVDPISGEFRRRIPFARPHIHHILEWE